MPVTSTESRLPRALLPFALPQYRWLALGLALALFGDGVWLVGVVWQVIGLGGGPGDVSLVSGVAAVGMIAATLVGGVLADRVDQRAIVVGLESVKLLAFGSAGLAAWLGVLTFAHLVIAALLGGITTGVYYPAYSALLPRVVAAAQLQAANGIEGFLRPVLYQAAGPMLAGVVIGAASPGTAIVVAALAAAAAGACYLAMGPVPHPHDDDDRPPTPQAADEARRLSRRGAGRDESKPPTPVSALLHDLGEGFGYVRRTPWLWATLLYACFLVLMTMGPVEVLVPFALRDRAGGDASSHALVLAAFGAGAAVGALVFAAIPMPRRYLTLMFTLWAVCSVPLVIMGFARHTGWFVLAGFLMGLALDGPMVLWGTLLQRRVPAALLGRVSSLDFFVSAALMPVSMALAAPVGHLIGIGWTFVLAGLLPVPVAVGFYLAARLWRDETANPLRVQEIGVRLPG